MKEHKKSIIGISLIILVLLSFNVVAPNIYAQTTDCDQFIFNWFMLNDCIVSLTPKYELLCQNELDASATSLSCSSFPARKYLIAVIETRLVTSGIDIGIQFNSDTGNNYAWRKSANGGADTTGLNENNCLTQNPSAGMNQLFTLNISNNLSSEEKIMYGTIVNSGNSGAGNVAGRMEIACKWANTSSQITTITIMRDAGTGSYNTDTRITVWGWD